VEPLTASGLATVTMMLVTYALEARSPWFVLAFAVACALGSACGFLSVWRRGVGLGAGGAATLVGRKGWLRPLVASVGGKD
jgi:hypothetical protein